MNVYDLYGCRVHDISDHLHYLSQVLGVEWEARSSDYKGAYHRAGNGRYGGSFEVRPNAIPGEDEPAETAFPGATFLFYANKLKHPDELRSILASEGTWSLLRRTEV